MSADRLREAARLMRERAEAATPGPWTCYGDHLAWPSEKGPAANDPLLAMVGEAHQDSAAHIASWHPAVALAVADWLDAEAESHRADVVGPFPSACCRMSQALAVAVAYLGSDSALDPGLRCECVGGPHGGFTCKACS